jgi:hypothetical protein
VVFAPILFTSYANWITAQARELDHKKQQLCEDTTEELTAEISLIEKG